MMSSSLPTAGNGLSWMLAWQILPQLQVSPGPRLAAVLGQQSERDKEAEEAHP